MSSVPRTPLLPMMRFQRRKRLERFASIAAIVIITAAWFYGLTTQHSDASELVANVLPDVVRVVEDRGIFIGYDSQDSNTPVGYAGVGEAVGYGGPVRLLVGVDPAGEVVGIQVIQHRETPGFFRRLHESGFFRQFLGRTSDSPMLLGQDIDGISGATLSAEAIAAGIRQTVYEITATELKPEPRPVAFGLPEITLIALYAVGLFSARSHNVHLKKYLRIGMLIAGVVLLGFVFNRPLTVAHVTSFLAGYWPDWRNDLYWFLLLGGVVLITFVRGKNPYCSWFCPFGAVQECFGMLGGAKPYRPARLNRYLKWFQRSLAFAAIVLGLALRQPTVTSYEPFSTLFTLRGTLFVWALLVIVLFASMIIRRPFCNYLCPIDPVVDFVGFVRNWLRQQ